MSVRISVFAATLLVFVSGYFVFEPEAQAQIQASCTFKYFSAPSGYAGDLLATGINHYNTVVGGTYTANNNSEKGFIRYSGGGMTLFGFPGANYTSLSKRNASGASVGQYGPQDGSVAFGLHGLMLTSKSYATLDYPAANGTILNGINKSNVIVGNAVDSNGGSFGFKHSNGTFSQIKYPHAVQTTATSINDKGVIVGGYEDGSFENPWSGYILQNGKFQSLKFIPADINNFGTIVAGNLIRYANGATKQVKVPGAFETFVNGINDLGTITGSANFGPNSQGNFTWKGFTATCK